MGALRFRDEAGLFQASAASPASAASAPAGQRRNPLLVELRHLMNASRAVELSTETEADLAYLRGKGTSLGGLCPKCSVLNDNGHLAIGKFPSVTNQRAVTKGEILTLHLARLDSINAANARLIHSDGLPVAVVRRFDRLPGGGRIPYCSAATMLGISVDDSNITPIPKSSMSSASTARRLNKTLTNSGGASPFRF